ncbi:type IV pilus secretin PilQ [Acidobacteriota bacterium]
MKRAKYIPILSFLFILFMLYTPANSNEPIVNLNNISVQPGKFNTKIVLEADSPLPFPSSYYSKEYPSTLILDLTNVETTVEPKFITDSFALLERINIEKTDSDNLRLFVELKESVPYRIFSLDHSTTLELTKILRPAEKDLYDPEIEAVLKKKTADFTHLREVQVSANQDEVNIAAKLSNTALFNVFALDNPLRLVVDLFNTLYSEPTSVYPVHELGIEKVRTSQYQSSETNPISRMVFDLIRPKLYALDLKNEDLVFSFYKDMKPASTGLNGPTAETPEQDIAEESIPGKPEKSEEEENKLKMDLEDLPEPEKSPETSSPASPEDKEIDTPTPIIQPEADEETGPSLQEEKPEKKKIDPTAKETTDDPLGSEEPVEKAPAGVSFPEVQFQPRVIAETQSTYEGEKLSLQFKDADLRDVILYLGEFANMNVVFDPEVRGVVTCDLEDVPWDQALDIILKINKVGKSVEGNVLRIAPIGILTREQEEQRTLIESKELAGPILVKTFTLSYSKARDVQALLASKVSDRGEIIVDDRTNTLIISEVRDKMEILEKLIEVFDTATPQVSIEARIVEATSNFVRNLGIQWGFRGVADPFYGNQTSLQFPNKALVDGALIPQGIATKGIGGPLGGYAVNLPAPAFSTAIGISFANVLDTFRLDMAISALESSGEGRIISCPVVTTQNNKEAEILQGRQIPVQTVSNFTVTTRYVNAALELKATPQITADGTIIMNVEIRNNAADFANLVNGIPPIITQSANTVVMVPDGGTTVIGGIYRIEDSITRERVPFLHKIPILGNLFRSFARTKQNRELLIFITPRINKQ